MSAKTEVTYPIAMYWRIAEKRLQEKRDSINKYSKSKVYDISRSGVKYYVDIYPNGDNDEHRGQTWIFVHFELWGTKDIQADYTISVETVKVSKKFVHEFTQSAARGGSFGTTAMVLDVKNNFIVDGEMVIKVDGFLKIVTDIPKRVFYIADEAGTLGAKLWKQDDKDFTLVVDGKEIAIHKNILACRSPVFTAMFKSNTWDAKESKATIHGFSFKTVLMAIKLCYHHSLVQDASLEDQILLLKFFDKFDIQSLKNKLEEYMISEVIESNVCRYANSSVVANATKLRKKCSEFLRDCAKKSLAISDFDILDKEFALNLLKNVFYHVSV